MALLLLHQTGVGGRLLLVLLAATAVVIAAALFTDSAGAVAGWLLETDANSNISA